MVELALCLPLLVSILLIVIDGTMTLHHAWTLQDAVHQTARACATGEIGVREAPRLLKSLLRTDPNFPIEDLKFRISEGLDSTGAPIVTIHADLELKSFGFLRMRWVKIGSTATYRKEKDS